MDPKQSLLDQLRIERPEHVRERKAPSRTRWMIAATILVIAVAGGIWLFASARGGIAVRAVVARSIGGGTSSAASGALLQASGYVVALREATVSAKAIYKVNTVLVQEGQAVKRGEVIARLDDSNVNAALEQSKTQLRQSEATLAAAKLAAADALPSYRRDQRQLAASLISSATFDASKARYDAAVSAVAIDEQNVVAARAAVGVNQSFENDTIIKAPFDGVVTARNAQPGQIVSPQFLGGGGIADIVDMDSLEVDVDVSEDLIHLVHPGQSASITLNAFPDEQVPARVIAIIPTADRAKATVKVRVGFAARDPHVLPEMSAQVAFFASAPRGGAGAGQRAQNVLVPADAVDGAGQFGTVFVIDGDHVESRKVQLGSRSAEGQIILAGVKPGTALAAGSLNRLRDGSRVRISP